MESRVHRSNQNVVVLNVELVHEHDELGELDLAAPVVVDVLRELHDVLAGQHDDDDDDRSFVRSSLSV